MDKEEAFFATPDEKEVVGAGHKFGRTGRRRKRQQAPLAGKKRNQGVALAKKEEQKKKRPKPMEDRAAVEGKDPKVVRKKKRDLEKGGLRTRTGHAKDAPTLASVQATGPEKTEMLELAEDLEKAVNGSTEYFTLVARRTLLLPDNTLGSLDEELLVHWVFPSAVVLDEYYEDMRISRSTLMEVIDETPTALRHAVAKVWKCQARGALYIPSGTAMRQFCLAVLDCLSRESEFSSSTEEALVHSEDRLRVHRRRTKLLLKEVMEREGKSAVVDEIPFKDPELSGEKESPRPDVKPKSAHAAAVAIAASRGGDDKDARTDKRDGKNVKGVVENTSEKSSEETSGSVSNSVPASSGSSKSSSRHSSASASSS